MLVEILIRNNTRGHQVQNGVQKSTRSSYARDSYTELLFCIGLCQWLHMKFWLYKLICAAVWTKTVTTKTKYWTEKNSEGWNRTGAIFLPFFTLRLRNPPRWVSTIPSQNNLRGISIPIKKSSSSSWAFLNPH